MSKTGCPLHMKDVFLCAVDVIETSLSILIVLSTENLSVAKRMTPLRFKQSTMS